MVSVIYLCLIQHPLTNAWCSDVARNSMLDSNMMLSIPTIPSGEYMCMY